MNEDTIIFLNNVDFKNSDIVYETVASLYEENKQLKGKLEMAKNNQKQASDSCRQHRLASKNHIRRLERREKQILRLKKQLEKERKAKKS